MPPIISGPECDAVSPQKIDMIFHIHTHRFHISIASVWFVHFREEKHNRMREWKLNKRRRKYDVHTGAGARTHWDDEKKKKKKKQNEEPTSKIER